MTGPVEGDPGIPGGMGAPDWPVIGLMVPGTLLEGVKNTVGTGEIEILGLGTVWLIGKSLGRLIGDDGVGLLATGLGGAAFWQAAKRLTRLKNMPDLKTCDIEK